MENFSCVSTPSASPTSGFIFFFFKKKRENIAESQANVNWFQRYKKTKNKKKNTAAEIIPWKWPKWYDNW